MILFQCCQISKKGFFGFSQSPLIHFESSQVGNTDPFGSNGKEGAVAFSPDTFNLLYKKAHYTFWKQNCIISCVCFTATRKSSQMSWKRFLLSETILRAFFWQYLFGIFHVKFQKSKLPTNLKDLLRQRPLASTIVHQFSPTLSKNSSSSKLFQKLLRRWWCLQQTFVVLEVPSRCSCWVQFSSAFWPQEPPDIVMKGHLEW